ncbi:MAG: hypothetical protein WD066_12745 [Planctomycetaceae bacterium]
MDATRTGRIVLAVILIVAALIVWGGPFVGFRPPFAVSAALLLAIMGISLYVAFRLDSTSRSR